MAPHPFGAFRKLDDVNPILGPQAEPWFACPFAGRVEWEAKDVFNPAAIVHRGRVALLYRAEDRVGRHAGTSRIGLAFSDDGIHFRREQRPVLFPTQDAWSRYEWEGGCEDPRVVRLPGGNYLMTYTMYDGRTARLATATSRDLWTWDKHGPAFPDDPDLWSKSGAVVTRDGADGPEAALIGGRLWMYWGESELYAATSADGVRWDIVRDRAGHLRPVMGPRPGCLDSQLVEPGPPPLLTRDGIVLAYHGKNAEGAAGDASRPAGSYCLFTATFDLVDPTQLIARDDEPWMVPDRPIETEGQVPQVCFAEGLVRFQDRWLLYYGAGDSCISVAAAVDRL